MIDFGQHGSRLRQVCTDHRRYAKRLRAFGWQLFRIWRREHPEAAIDLRFLMGNNSPCETASGCIPRPPDDRLCMSRTS